MSYGVTVICRLEVSTGFALAGWPTHEVATDIEAGQRLLELAAHADTGVVLMQDDLYEAMSPEVLRMLAKRPLPMVVPFPGPVWDESLRGPEGYIVEMLRQAIGYRVRLR
ncbi:MAG: hypothetical protein GX536_00670 [Actinobacteria bacterium]|nr:hypothetical protein [Actinomycetota bacterium]